MSRRDIDLALRLIAERLPHLRQPRRLNPCAFPAGRRVLGQYRLLTDSLRLNACYLEDLDELQALDLLDTLLHELLHKNSGLLRQVRDTFRHIPTSGTKRADCATFSRTNFLRAEESATAIFRAPEPFFCLLAAGIGLQATIHAGLRDFSLKPLTDCVQSRHACDGLANEPGA